MTSRLLRAELHAHTVYSQDGHITFEEMTRMLERRRIDVVAITDHDTIAGALEFKRWYTRSAASLHLVVGEEKTLDDGSHVVGLFLKEAIHSGNLADAIQEIGEQRAVTVLPHPFRHRDGPLRHPASAKLVDVCYEIFNPKCNHHENSAARELLDTGLLPVGGSDAHYASDLGECLNVLPFVGNVEESLRRALTGKSPLAIWGTPQAPGDRGRRYAPVYYRLKPHLHVPRRLVPLAGRLYGVYRNKVHGWREPKLELKHECH